MNLCKRKRLSYPMVLMILAVLLIIAIIISFMLGRYPVSPKELFGIILDRILTGLFPKGRISIPQFWEDKMELVVLNIRFPRILLACLVGCCLSAAGAAFQGVFQNPMASPDLLGASSGAAFGAALAIYLNRGSGMIVVFAFISSLVCVLLVIVVSERAKGKKVIGLILSGIMISSLFSSGTSFIKLVADTTDQLPAITYWLMGSLSAAKKSDLLFALIPMVIGLVPLFLLRWRINILTMGDDEARTMGVNAKRARFIVIVCATLVTAASVSVSGLIGWIGLVIPHLARRLVGNNYKVLMPATMLFGAIFLLIVDDVCRNLLATEIPIGILMAFVGAPFFIYLIMRDGERH